MRITHLLLSATAAAAVAVSGLGVATPAQSAPPAAPGSSVTVERALSPFEVTLKASTAELVLGERVTLKGKVLPKAPGKKVILEKRLEGRKWVKERTTELTKRSRFTFKDKPTTVGMREYRVVKPASAKHAKGVSPAVAVTLYRWHNLTALAPREVMYVGVDTALIDTVEYPKSLVAQWYYPDSYDPATSEWFRDYNLQRDCSTLVATYGMDDRADVGSSIQVEVRNDGVSAYTATFGFLESEKKKIDLHGVFRLGFHFSSTFEGGSPAGVVGSPRILCAF